MLNVDFVDSTDPDRIVVPEKDLGTHWLCRVYWREAGFGGKVKLAKSLFNNMYYGFMPKD
jgi:hypothetical protein